MDLWKRLCQQITADELKAIAAADYGRDFDEHYRALENLRQRKAFFPITSWYPQEALELTRWPEVNDLNARLTAFCSAALLISSFHPESHGRHPFINSNLIVFIESLRRLEPDLMAMAYDFIEALMARLGQTPWDEETPYLYLARALIAVHAGRVAGGHFEHLDAYDQAFRREITDNELLPSSVTSLFELSFDDQRQDLWLQSIRDAGLAHAHDSLKPPESVK